MWTVPAELCAHDVSEHGEAGEDDGLEVGRAAGGVSANTFIPSTEND